LRISWNGLSELMRISLDRFEERRNGATWHSDRLLPTSPIYPDETTIQAFLKYNYKNVLIRTIFKTLKPLNYVLRASITII
jgi:hypothetical protein